MNYPSLPSSARLLTGACALFCALSGMAEQALIRLNVDATAAPRRILHADLRVPVQPGPLTLLYPKWLPGEHGPTGPIIDLVGLKMSAAGNPLPWRRDDEDMFAFHLEVPAGVETVEIALEFLLPPEGEGFTAGASATPHLVDLSWNQVLLYPRGAPAAQLRYAATLRLPERWKFGTALPVATQAGNWVEFAPVSLETLVDSPLIAGVHFRTVDLTPETEPKHFLHMVADSAEALEITPRTSRSLADLTVQAGALFGAQHYRAYHFLLTLSDHVTHFGLEHHESSDNRVPERVLVDEELGNLWAGLLPHEMVHSWNGKYRRPAGLATPDFQQPMRGELLWVYEGLTMYLGNVLTVRSGLWSGADFRADLALAAATLDRQGGRAWRPLADTTVAAQLLYLARPEGTARRRSVDFYPEGLLIWMEADVLIRQQTAGRRSLDDFCRLFFGGESGSPGVVTYSYDGLLEVLNEVAPSDWREFFQARVYAANPRAPLGGIEGAGWRLVYRETVPEMIQALENTHKTADLSFSLGLSVKEDGAIQDVLPGSPADVGGVAPATRLVAVNGRRWSPALLRAAVKAARASTAPIELLIEDGEFFRTCRLDYHDGEKYPELERDPDQADLLADILKPLPSPSAAGSASE